MYVRDYEKPLMQFSGFRVHKYLLAYVPPVLLLMGTIGNALSAVILTRRPMRKYSTYFYLAALSAADLIVLYLGLLRLWIGELTGKDLIDHSDWSCKIITVVGYSVSDYSGWLIIAVTGERYMAVCRPLKTQCICSRERAIKVVLILLLILFLLNCHFFWTVQIIYIHHNDDSIAQCAGGERYGMLINEVWPWIDAFIYSFLPFVIILVLNTLIIRQIIRAKKNRLRLQMCGSQVSGLKVSHMDSGKISVMLLTISIAFLVLTMPINILLIVTRFPTTEINTIEQMINFRLALTVMELLMYLNHSINFILYCATGQKFRQQLCWLLSHKKPPQSHSVPPSENSLWPLTQSHLLTNPNTLRHLEMELAPIAGRRKEEREVITITCRLNRA